MVTQCLDLLLGRLIYVVLVLFMLTTIRSFFVFSLFWLIKLILVHVNFVTQLTWDSDQEELLENRVTNH
jgi:hypothetical protein